MGENHRKDPLGVRAAMATIASTIANKNLKPPFVVGILGRWGSGKKKVKQILFEELQQVQRIDLTDKRTLENNVYVGHCYKVSFSAWEFQKKNIWAAFLSRILQELNDQFTLEDMLKSECLSNDKQQERFETGQTDLNEPLLSQEGSNNAPYGTVDEVSKAKDHLLIKGVLSTMQLAEELSQSKKKYLQVISENKDQFDKFLFDQLKDHNHLGGHASDKMTTIIDKHLEEDNKKYQQNKKALRETVNQEGLKKSNDKIAEVVMNI